MRCAKRTPIKLLQPLGVITKFHKGGKMRKYEMMIVFDEEVAAIEQCKTFLHDTLKEHSVKILEEKDLGVKDLAYEINKKKKGHYFQFILEAEQSVWVEIQKIFKITKSVMRYVILNQEG